ncbi:trans-sialidase, putative [Trypanosoma cruzi marinkellei]|uniref:Trans-sialidase, putative n=1 Tax=Trypanosoma cruzi marinkellei TaxID=85056 RepID=K2LXK4_TRYCR|nr:trans-sialidase, putative [Trypanosoma cruzi marinkellei]
MIGSGGSGVRMNDGTIVFPVQGTKKTTKDGRKEDGKTVSLIIYSTDNTNWKVSKGMSDGGCGDSSVAEWKDGKLMMMTACDDGRRRVYEIGDKEKSWTEALGTLSRVWGNNHNRHERAVGSGFITATLDGVEDNGNVMLVTLPVYSKEDYKNGKEEDRRGELHLWLTDNTHIVDIGPVSGGDDAAASSLLYRSGKNENKKGEELIALYEKKSDMDKLSPPGMFSVRLTAQLQRVKEVLATWKEVDKRVSQLCTTLLATKGFLGRGACSAINITDGLVGFLFGNFSDNTWRDEYLGVNAKVHNNNDEANTKARKTSNGVTFQGAWAEWPVGRQGENQLYHFANYNFTLVATVSIHEMPKEGTIPLMGVRSGSNGENRLMELSYDSEKKWQVLCSDGTTKRLKSTWEKNTTHHVAIVLQNGNQGSVYVNGKRVCGNAQREMGAAESKEISHFYIGGDGGSAVSTGSREDVSVTVKNVLLYNRPLAFPGGNADVEGDNASPSGAVSRTAAGNQMTTEGTPATTQQAPTAPGPHAVQQATGDAGTARENGLLPSLLLLLLGLWVFAAL